MFLPTLKDSFHNKKVACKDFLSFMDGNLARMKGQNQPDQYTAMISALQSHRRAYADFLGTQDANLGERLGNTDAV